MVSTNASGLTPEESRKLPRREPRSDEAEIISKLKEVQRTRNVTDCSADQWSTAVLEQADERELLDLCAQRVSPLLGRTHAHH